MLDALTVTSDGIHPSRRIISLLPSATEIVAALGALDRLVAITHDCDFPLAAIGRPRVTSTSVDPNAAPAVVDAQVRALAHSGTPVFVLDEARIRALDPDLILTQALCEVCAISETEVHAMAATRLPSKPSVVTLSATTLDSVVDDIVTVAAAIGLPESGETLVASLRARLLAVHERLKAARAPRPAVAVIEWVDPLYTAGHWVPDMVHRAGGRDVLARPGDHSTVIAPDAVAATRPDLVVIAPCGYDVARAEEAARGLIGAPWLGDAVVWAVDGGGLFSRPGPRIIDGVETLAAIMHPTLFPAPPSRAAGRATVWNKA
jgi:iron complex transport system substrate-binding protein